MNNLKKEVCGGKTLSWREIFKIMEKNKKYTKILFKKVKQIINSKKGKEIKKQYRPNIKIERTKREKSKIFVKLGKHLRRNTDLKKILKLKFLFEKKIQMQKTNPTVITRKEKTKFRSSKEAKIKRRIKKIKKQKMINKLLKKLKRKSQRFIKRKCIFSRSCQCKFKGKKVTFTKKLKKPQTF